MSGGGSDDNGGDGDLPPYDEPGPIVSRRGLLPADPPEDEPGRIGRVPPAAAPAASEGGDGDGDGDGESGPGSGMNVVYLSDISRMLPETEAFILDRLPPTDVLIIDSLLVDRAHPVHFSLRQAIGLARRLGPKKVYVVGMNCDDFKPHAEMNEELREVEGLDIQLAHDGLVVEA